MRLLILLILISGGCSRQNTEMVQEKDSQALYTVSGKIMQKSSYCGGARPSKKILEKYKTPKPLGNMKLYVKEGKENSDNAVYIDSTLTNEMGEYSFSLPAGEYIIVSESQLSSQNFSKILDNKHLKIMDQDCIDEWYKRGLLKFELKTENVVDLDYLQKKKCYKPEGIPCLKYTGPLRP